ncbi:hypothetical protein D3C72_535360 [compost metagenome]
MTLAFTTSGCWWLRQEARTPERPVSKLAPRGISTLGVVPFGDATLQHVGTRVSEVFRTTMVTAIGKEWVRQQDLIEPPSGPKPIGFIGISQAQQLGRLNGVDGLLSGQVLAYEYQRPQGRVWVSVSLRLLEATRGTIIWSRNAKGTFPARTSAEKDDGFNAATHLAAKEFVHDLLGSQP